MYFSRSRARQVKLYKQRSRETEGVVFTRKCLNGEDFKETSIFSNLKVLREKEKFINVQQHKVDM